MDPRTMAGHSHSTATATDPAFRDDLLDGGLGPACLVPQWSEASPSWQGEQADTGAPWPPLGASSLGHHPEEDSRCAAPLSLHQMNPGCLGAQTAASERHRRAMNGRKQRSRDTERQLKAQLQRLKQEQDVLAAERSRLQQVTAIMEHELRRRDDAAQRLTPPADPRADTDCLSLY
ncbi:hypothetical protein GWK47_011195 [Chionoecetes opilio]|uniref:Uncharacterized protein n=1 Tax=Chionoecetes opilio TaxID=41210 RepID=A0A8J4Y0N4_CHIOP|nr:hypothetical protein GWK47_011195 [Chionoecetes opilio]